MFNRMKNYFSLYGKLRNAYDLIKSQKDEIEGLIMANEILKGYVLKLGKELERANIKNESLEAEIKRLKNEVNYES